MVSDQLCEPCGSLLSGFEDTSLMYVSGAHLIIYIGYFVW
jgi:hypothetical protein